VTQVMYCNTLESKHRKWGTGTVSDETDRDTPYRGGLSVRPLSAHTTRVAMDRAVLQPVRSKAKLLRRLAATNQADKSGLCSTTSSPPVVAVDPALNTHKYGHLAPVALLGRLGPRVGRSCFLMALCASGGHCGPSLRSNPNCPAHTAERVRPAHLRIAPVPPCVEFQRIARLRLRRTAPGHARHWKPESHTQSPVSLLRDCPPAGVYEAALGETKPPCPAPLFPRAKASPRSPWPNPPWVFAGSPPCEPSPFCLAPRPRPSLGKRPMAGIGRLGSWSAALIPVPSNSSRRDPPDVPQLRDVAVPCGQFPAPLLRASITESGLGLWALGRWDVLAKSEIECSSHKSSVEIAGEPITSGEN